MTIGRDSRILIFTRKSYLCFLFALLLACQPANPTPTPRLAWAPINLNLPTRTFVTALASDPRNPQKIYAATYSTDGLYSSADGGATWRQDNQGLAALPVLAVLTSGDQVFAATPAGLYRRTGTADWIRIETAPGIVINALAQDSSGSVYAATGGQGIWKSTSDGKWTRLAGLEGEILLSIAPLDSQTLIVGTSGHGAFITHDGGANWQSIDNLTGEFVSLAAVDPRDPKTIYLGTRGGLYRSRDGGSHWDLLSGGIETEIIHAILFVPGRIYTATDSHGIFVTTDDGVSWQRLTVGLSGSGALLAFAQVGAQTLLVGAQNGIYRSQDAGNTWQSTNIGLGFPQIHALALNPHNGILFVATDDGLYRAAPNGNFTYVGNDAMQVPMLSVTLAPSDPQVVYAGSSGHGIFASQDGGDTWDSAGDIFNGRLAVPGLFVNPSDAHTVFARVLYQRLYKSSDSGRTWHAVWSGMRDGDLVTAVDIAPNYPTQMLAATGDGLYLSNNSGESWQGTGLAGLSEFAIWIDAQDARDILVGATDGLYRRGAGDTDWRHSGLTGITVTTIVGAANGEFFVGTKYNGVWLSRDGAKDWAAFGAGLQDTSIIALALDDAHRVLYAATPQGLYKISTP